MATTITSPPSIADLQAVDSYGAATRHAKDMQEHLALLEKRGEHLEAAALRALLGTFIARKVAAAQRPKFFARRGR